jgi:hypothetical protein
MTYRLSGDQTRMLRLRAQRLIPQDARTSAGVARVVSDVCGVQAQDLPAARLSIRARSAGLTTAQVEEERQEKRSIAWTWCMRGTLHLVSAEDAAWLVPFLGPELIAADRRRMSQLGWDEELTAAGIRLLIEALAKGGGLTRLEVIRLMEENGLPFEGQAPVHLLYRAALEGRLCAGPDRGKKPTYMRFVDWLGKLKPLPRPEALAKIARRYLAAYAPARPEDLASWSGLKLGEARKAWKLIDGELVEVEVAGQPAWMLKTMLPWLDELTCDPPLVRLLPRYDTYLLGYADRELVVDPAYAKRIHPGGGVVNPVLLVDGRALGTWKTQRQKNRLEVTVWPFADLPGDLQPLIEAEVADLRRFLGEETIYG